MKKKVIRILDLINGVQWDSKFEGYNNIKPYPITVTYRKNGKKHTVKRNITGKDAFNNHFVDKVKAVSEWLEEKGHTNIRFLLTVCFLPFLLLRVDMVLRLLVVTPAYNVELLPKNICVKYSRLRHLSINMLSF